MFENLLVITDPQAPFHHPHAVDFIRAKYKEHKCDTVVCIGDELDNKYLKYLSINDPMTARQQHMYAIRTFFRPLFESFPRMWIVNSNHVAERLSNAAAKVMIPDLMLKSVKEYLRAPPDWLWEDSWIFDGVKFEHGDRFGGKYAHVQALGSAWGSIIIGHHPIQGVEYVMKNGVLYFGACGGSMTRDANKERMAFGLTYSKKYATEMPRGLLIVKKTKFKKAPHKVIIEPFGG